MIGALCGPEMAGDGALGGINRFFTGATTPGKWTVSFGYRWQDSFRHFVGDVEQPQRVAQDTQQENKIHLFDVALSYSTLR